jgi:hypothetical protein
VLQGVADRALRYRARLQPEVAAQAVGR